MSKFTLHDYQQKMIDDVRQAYRDGYKSPCVVAPCGAGKSVVISEIARMTTENKGNVLFLVHRKELIDQIRNTFIRNGVNIKYVTFGMVQTVVRCMDKIPYPALIITDENHHAKAATYKKIYDFFDSVLRLGFTATPVRLNGEGLKDVNDVLVPSVNVQWLINNQFLAPFEYYTFDGIDRKKLKKSSTGDYSNESIDESLGKTIYGDVLRNYIEKGKEGQAIVYCHSIDFSKKIESMFNENGYTCRHIDAKTNKNERDEIIQKFRDKEIKILTNVDLIGEGFDVPDCTVVIMLRPTKSLSLFIQQSMRSMRYKKGKKAVVLDHVMNCNEHGLPSTQRSWSLEGDKKKKSKREKECQIRECVLCYAANYISAKRCVVCGETFKKICKTCDTPNELEATECDECGALFGKKIKVDNNATLIQVTDDDFDFTMDFRKPEDCRTLKELQELAKNLGYKRGWAWYQAKQLNILK